METGVRLLAHRESPSPSPSDPHHLFMLSLSFCNKILKEERREGKKEEGRKGRVRRKEERKTKSENKLECANLSSSNTETNHQSEG